MGVQDTTKEGYNDIFKNRNQALALAKVVHSVGADPNTKQAKAMTAFQDAYITYINNQEKADITDLTKKLTTLKELLPGLDKVLKTSGLTDTATQAKEIFEKKQGSIQKGGSIEIAGKMLDAYQKNIPKAQEKAKESLKNYYTNTKNLLDNFVSYIKPEISKTSLQGAVNAAITSIDGNVKTLNVPATVLFSQLSGFR